jgi:hypothetical protein
MKKQERLTLLAGKIGLLNGTGQFRKVKQPQLGRKYHKGKVMPASTNIQHLGRRGQDKFT